MYHGKAFLSLLEKDHHICFNRFKGNELMRKKTLGFFLFVSIYFVGYTFLESHWLAGLKICMITAEHASSITATTPSVLLPPFTVSKCLKDGVSSPEQSSFCPNKPDESDRTSVLGDAHFFTLHCLFTFYDD